MGVLGGGGGGKKVYLENVYVLVLFLRHSKSKENPHNRAWAGMQQQMMHWLSGPVRLRVQSRSRTRSRIAASIAFLFSACFKGVFDTTAPLSRG